MMLETSGQNRYNTLVFGYGDVVRNKYLEGMSKDEWRKAAFVESKDVTDSSDKILRWDSKELTQFIEQQLITRFIIATTPESHGPILDYLCDKIQYKTAQIFVEKPFFASTDLFSESYIRTCESKSNLDIFCIDHYVAKPVILWLRLNIVELVGRFGQAQRIAFTSFETKSFGNIDTFKVGYAIEHGVHALPCFEYILGPLFKTVDQVAVTNSDIEFYESQGEKFANKFDFQFTVKTEQPENSLASHRLEMVIQGGKRHPIDQKFIEIEFENGVVNCGLNTNVITINDEPVTASLKQQSAYESIFQDIFEFGANSNLLLQPRQAMKSVELMEFGSRHALQEYRP